MNNKLRIGEEELDKKFNLRTTEFIFNKMLVEAQQKHNGSINLLINKVFFKRYNKIKIPKTNDQ